MNNKRIQSRTVVVIGTGGTIAGVAEDPSRPYAYEDCLLEISVPLAGLPIVPGVRIESHQILQIGSEDFDAGVWSTIRAEVLKHLGRKEVCGVVVTQGTDTIEETAFFLHLTLSNRKPVVVTGAMRPFRSLSSDAEINLYQSVSLAGHPTAAGRGTMVLMNERVYSPTGVTKDHTFAADSFSGGDEATLAIMLGGEPKWLRTIRPMKLLEKVALRALRRALPQVDLIWAFAGIGPNYIDSIVSTGAKGLVYAGTGNGTVASAVKPALARAASQGCLVVRASRVPHGIVVQNAAESDDELGTVASLRLSPVKARIALQLAIGACLSKSELAEVFEEISFQN